MEKSKVRLGEIAEVIPGYAFKSKDFGLDGVCIIKIGDIQPPVVNISECQRISPEKVSGLEKFKLTKGDFVLAMTGATIGKVGRYLSEEVGFLNQRVAKFNSKKGVSDKQFLYYLITSREISNEIINRGLGSAQPNVSGKDIESIEVEVPPLPTQKAIAEILSSLDDKIELNNQINQNLEALAQALFKQWFVDFEFPFDFTQGRPNENGEPYKSSGGEMVDSELGEIPKGWDVLELGIVSDLLAGGDKPKNYSLIQTDELKTPIYSNGVSQEGLYGFTDIPKVIEESVTVSARGTIGFVCLRTQPYVPIVRLISAIPKEGFITNKYLYLWLKNQKIYGNGTTQQQLTIPDFKKSKILVPNYDILLKITQVWNSFFESIFKIREENKHLINLRDTLLPKLISGELEVSQLEKEVYG